MDRGSIEREIIVATVAASISGKIEDRATPVSSMMRTTVETGP
jgi:hypothetical protein